jgi:hypothetical protein
VSRRVAVCSGERFTASDITKEVTGDAQEVRKALEIVARANPHVHQEPNPKHSKSTLYFYDSGGLSIDGEPMTGGNALKALQLSHI